MNDFSRLRFGKELIRLAKDHDFVIFNADTKSCSIGNTPNATFHSVSRSRTS